MNRSCELGFDADLLARAARGEVGADARAVTEHAGRCEACAQRLVALAAIKETWSEVTRERPLETRRRDLRALRRFDRRASSRSFGGFSFGIVVGAAMTAVVLLALGRGDRREPDARVASSPPPVSAAVMPVPPPPAPLAAPARTHASGSGRQVVVKSASREVVVDSASSVVDLAPGTPLPEHAAVDVPAGASLRLAFSLSDAILDPEVGFTVDGPARARTDGEGDAIGLERGHGLLSAHASSAVRTAQALIVVTNGRVTIDAGAVTRVVVHSGVARITTAAARDRELTAGDGATIDAEGRLEMAPRAVSAAAAAAPAPAPAPPQAEPLAAEPSAIVPPDARWAAVIRALDAGDRVLAERELGAILRDAATATPLRARASFALAELELARGAVIVARPRLEQLLAGPEEQLAEEAATLLARSYPTPGERAVAWTKYLATSPPSPRRERALVEEIRALVASGATEAAQAVARSCGAPGDPRCREALAAAGMR